MDWVNSAVDDFCKVSGIESSFENSGMVQLLFERSGLLNIEVVNENLMLFLTRKIEWHQREEYQLKALRLCHYDQGLPFSIRTGMLNKESLVMMASVPLDEVTLPAIEQAFNLLSRLHDEITDQ